jgi:hypothetical protein
VLDGTTIQGRQDLRTGPVMRNWLRYAATIQPRRLVLTRTLVLGDDGHVEGIGRFPNVIGNSLLSSVFVNDRLTHYVGGPIKPGKLEAIKKNGTFQPLMKTDFGVGNFICIKSGPQSEDQDADETCWASQAWALPPAKANRSGWRWTMATSAV